MNLKVIKENFRADIFAFLGMSDVLLDSIKNAMESSQEIIGKNVFGQADTCVFHFGKAATDFGDQLLNVADVKGYVGKANVHASLIGGF